MLFNKQIEFTSAVKYKGAMIMFLLFLPSIMQASGLFRHFHSVVLDTFMSYSGQINWVFYFPTFASFFIVGPFGLLMYPITLVLAYIFACMLVVAWEMIFNGIFGRRSKIYQAIALAMLFIPLVYHAIYVPSLIASRFKVESSNPSEISISKDAKTFYDENGPFERYVLREFIVRNDNDFQMTHEVPREIRGACLYDTRTGIFAELGGYYAHEDGHGFVDSGTWNKLIIEPKSEARYYLLGDMALSDQYDEILLSKDGSDISDKYCYELTKEDIDKNKSIDIIKISK